MKKIITSILIFISILLIIFAFGESIGRIGDLHLAKVRPDVFESGSHDLHYVKNPLTMYFHVILGMVFLITGSYQLIPYFRKKSIVIHRIIGKVFLSTSFILSLSGIYLGLFLPFGDTIETFTNLVFGLFILYSTIMAYSTIKKKKVIEHSYWVRRIFFISLSIATIRFVMISFMVFSEKSLQESMGISFLIGFLLHFIIIEMWIRTDKQKRSL